MKKKLFLAGSLLLLSVALVYSARAPEQAEPGTTPTTGPVTFKMLNPTGAIEVTQLFAPRLADLQGKTICEINAGGWQARRTFPVIRELLQRQFPTAKIIPYTEFEGGGRNNEKNNSLLVKLGCQAVIVGNGG